MPAHLRVTSRPSRLPLLICIAVASLAAVLHGAEDAAVRAALPEFVTIPAATPAELTPTNHLPVAGSLRTWTVSQGDAGARRYSALTQINRHNVRQLVEAWRYDSHDGARNLQANPIVVDGVLYGPTAGRAIVALNAATGAELWRYQVEAPARMGLEDAPARRGLVYWPGDALSRSGDAAPSSPPVVSSAGDATPPPHPVVPSAGDATPSSRSSGPRLIFASGNWVYALDPHTGKPIAGFGQHGRTPLPTGGTAVGVIWRDTYIVPGLWGDVFAYNLRDGRPLWRFHTIPEAGEPGAETWHGSARDGAHPWGGMALDEARGIAYCAVGAARPDFIGVDRHGDNLYSDCLVALDARTGRLLWYFQNVRHDIWDLDNPAPPNLVTITRDGRKIDAIACVTKLGDTLLLDRVTGKTIFPFRLRRAPTTTLPGEETAPYQPDPELPEMISGQEVKGDDITNRTPAAHDFVARQVQRGTRGWFEPPTLGRPMLYHSSRGGAEWSGACVDVPTGRLYVTSNHLLSVATVHLSDEHERDPRLPPSGGETVFLQNCAQCHGQHREGAGMVPTLVGLRHRMTDDEVLALLKTGRAAMPPAPQLSDSQRHDLLDFLMRRNQPPPAKADSADAPRYFAVGYKFINDDEGYPGARPPWGLLNCLDLNTGKRLWSVPLGEYEKLTAAGLPKTGTENLGGPAITAGGLVFVGGTKDERIRAFDADTGEELWSAKLPFGGYAAPTIYEAEGREFVVIAATGGGKLGTRAGDAYVAFALPH